MPSIDGYYTLNLTCDAAAQMWQCDNTVDIDAETRSKAIAKARACGWTVNLAREVAYCPEHSGKKPKSVED